jgi:hypothetical protein
MRLRKTVRPFIHPFNNAPIDVAPDMTPVPASAESVNHTITHVYIMQSLKGSSYHTYKHEVFAIRSDRFITHNAV